MKNSTASKYRETVKDLSKLVFLYEGDDWPTAFQQHLNHLWEQDIIKFNILNIKSSDIKSSDDFRVGMFITAVGLMAFGRKEAIPFVLQGIPKIGTLNRLTIIILKLLPLPEHLQDLNKKNRNPRMARNPLRATYLG